MDQNKPVGEIIEDQLKSYSEKVVEIRNGWTIETVTYRVCMDCLVEGGEDADMGTTISEVNKMISLSHYVVVDDQDCDYVSEHEVDILDQPLAVDDDELLTRQVQAAIDEGVRNGRIVEVPQPDGSMKYKAA